MARYKYIDTNPKFLPVDLARQLLPGTFEHAVNHLLDNDIDLSSFDASFRNDETGAPAYQPAMLLKIVLVAYAHGVVSSRGIERLCRDHVIFVALCGDQAPHFTTIANFVSRLGDDIARVFGAVVAICDREGLIGHKMFAIDGLKLPSNASKHRSGTREDFEHQATKLEDKARKIIAIHRTVDESGTEPTLPEKDAERVKRLEERAAELRDWLRANPDDRRGPNGKVRQSNRTDNESAKMATSHGVIQGYTGAAAVDGKHQIIVEAQVFGTGSEQEALLPIVDGMKERDVLAGNSVVTADSGFHSEENLKELEKREVNAIVADNDMRRRDERFATQERYREKPDPLHNKSVSAAESRKLPLYQPSDFIYDPEARTCECPAGKSLYRTGKDIVNKDGFISERFRGTKRDCVPCQQRAQCLRDPGKTEVRQVAFFRGAVPEKPESQTQKMKRRIDTPEGREQYGARLGIVEPVFGNLRYNKGLTRFTLRGRSKVGGQWRLFCLVQNIEKLANHGYAQ
jgi:transposase